MNHTTDLPLLKAFFSANFHEDWDLDDATTADVVSRYISGGRAQELRDLGDAILKYLQQYGSDAELEHSLFYGLGCYYMPSADGLTAGEWLRGIASRLIESGRTTVANDRDQSAE